MPPVSRARSRQSARTRPRSSGPCTTSLDMTALPTFASPIDDMPGRTAGREQPDELQRDQVRNPDVRADGNLSGAPRSRVGLRQPEYGSCPRAMHLRTCGDMLAANSARRPLKKSAKPGLLPCRARARYPAAPQASEQLGTKVGRVLTRRIRTRACPDFPWRRRQARRRVFTGMD